MVVLKHSNTIDSQTDLRLPFVYTVKRHCVISRCVYPNLCEIHF